eukprot:COSAG06_NODE_25313_length_640_cov_0.667283_2_plen_59_part_01
MFNPKAPAFMSWMEMTADKKRERHKLRMIMVRFTNSCLVSALDAWRSTWLEQKQMQASA